ncbi:antibiotic biosynthesis monooxygenase [Paraburkholderia sp. Tr-20389]|uniref:antibiotic biosynthesis monooxygenase family protein n=1 Tax=Paraburkholderia sp. Tr-20389 TaxID=2703903 RepID=UPI00197DFCE8|nr:antibiotic biosynthesis monooxygenase [Paraburkholderia sp. Tr-20389]MBN3751510.1 antibiotic biosynthesis monooxygenase [Paraburkholderia sp. Tr-20389]
MVFELAHIVILPGKAAEFEAGVAEAVPLFLRAQGCSGVKLHRTIEHPEQYVLQVEWSKVDDHMITFRESADFQAWRQLVGPYFKEPPVVVHTEVVVG